jgi:hypothetical protein
VKKRGLFSSQLGQSEHGTGIGLVLVRALSAVSRHGRAGVGAISHAGS